MKAKGVVAPIAAVVLAAGVFVASSVSAATAEPAPQGEPMWIGAEPVFLTSHEAVSQWEQQIALEQQKYGKEFRFDTSAPGILLVDKSPEGDEHSYEQGLVNSLVARAVRCEKLASWLNDPSLTSNQVEANALEDWETFTSVPEIAQLLDLESYKEAVRSGAAIDGVTQAESEFVYQCTDFNGSNR